MWLDFAIAMSCGGGGVACGWVMHALGGFGNQTLVDKAAAKIVHNGFADGADRDRVEEVAKRLREYALNMAANVDAHQSKVLAVNHSLQEGVSDATPKVVFEAVHQLIAANEQMQQRLQEAQDRIHEQTVQIQTAERRAQTDSLTRVPNRGAFDHHLATRHALGPSKAGTLALLDVDHFKRFNDVYGHRAGDEVLKVVANLMQFRLQSFGLVARYGGEEFAVVLDNCRVEDAAQHLEAVRKAIGERDILFDDKCLRVNVSMGVAELLPEETVEQWLQRADDGLYRSKQAGRDCGHWMDQSEPVRIQWTAPTPANDPSSCSEAGVSSDPSHSENTNSLSAELEIPGVMSAPEDDDDAKGPADPGAFAYLPDREAMGVEYDEIKTRTAAKVAIFVAAIRFKTKPNESVSKSVLQIVRASMRSVDRLGCEDDSTILICMPSVDAKTAAARGQQLCQSAGALLQPSGQVSTRPITVGIAEAKSQEDFSQVVSRAITLSQRCEEQDEDCLCEGDNEVSSTS